MANPKPKKLKTSDINAILIGTIVVSILVVFSVIVFFDATTSGIIKKIGLFVVCWLLVFFSTIAIKAGALSGDRELNNKDWADATLSSFISSILIVGSTLMVAETTIVGRAFENTVGLYLIQLFKKGDQNLTESLGEIFTKMDGTPLNPELNIDLIFTQMFSPKKEFDDYIQYFNTQKPFPDVAIIQNTDKTNVFYENFVIRKNDISTAALASLATTAAILTCYKPIISPWINV